MVDTVKQHAGALDSRSSAIGGSTNQAVLADKGMQWLSSGGCTFLAVRSSNVPKPHRPKDAGHWQMSDSVCGRGQPRKSKKVIRYLTATDAPPSLQSTRQMPPPSPGRLAAARRAKPAKQSSCCFDGLGPRDLERSAARPTRSSSNEPRRPPAHAGLGPSTGRDAGSLE